MSGEEYPLCVSSGVLADSSAALTHGCAGLRDLWVLCPWGMDAILARGVVFDYREYVGPGVPSEARWIELVRQGIPKSPAWAAPVLSPVTPGK